MLILFKKGALAALVVFCVSGCAWNRGELAKWFKSEKKIDEEQLKSIGAKEEELEKFSIKEVPKSETDVQEAPKINSTAKSSEKRNSAVIKPVQKAKPLPVVKSKEVKKSFIYPEDYPDNLKELDKKTVDSWKIFKPILIENEKMMLDVDYLGMTVGKVVVGYKGLKMMNDRQVHHFQAFFKSAPFYSAIYELDDQLDTFVDKEYFVGKRYNLIQRESKQDIDEVQLYDHETLKTNAYQKQVRGKKVKNRKWEGFIPRWSIDPLSVLWLIRGMPLKNNDVYTLPVVNRAQTLVVTAKVEAREEITVNKKKVNAIRVQASSHYTGRTLKSGEMTLWFSDNETRSLLRMKAKIKIGSVFAEVTDG